MKRPLASLVESASAELRVCRSPRIRARESGTRGRLAGRRDRAARLTISRDRSPSRRGATIGLHRFSLTQLAARLAAPILAAERRAPATYLGSEAVAARATFEAQRERRARLLRPGGEGRPVSRARSRARCRKLRLAQVSAPRRWRGCRSAAADLVGPAGAIRRAVRGRLLRPIARRCSTRDRGSGRPMSPAPALRCQRRCCPARRAVRFRVEFAVPACADRVVSRRPHHRAVRRHPGAGSARSARARGGGARAERGHPISSRCAVICSRAAAARARAARGRRLFSAPGEGRECVEIARRILEEARRGVPFDEIAVFVRSPERYAGLLEHAFHARGHSRVVRPRHAPPASRGPRLSRHPRVRVREAVGPPLRRIPLARAGAAARRRAPRVRLHRA